MSNSSVLVDPSALIKLFTMNKSDSKFSSSAEIGTMFHQYEAHIKRKRLFQARNDMLAHVDKLNQELKMLTITVYKIQILEIQSAGRSLDHSILEQRKMISRKIEKLNDQIDTLIDHIKAIEDVIVNCL